VDPDRDPSDRHDHGHRQGEVADPAAAENDRDCNRKAGGRVVARKRGVVGRGDEQMHVGVGGERPRSIPDPGDQVGDQQREGGAEQRRDDPVARVAGGPLALREEEAGEQPDEQVLSVDGEEAQDVLEPVVLDRESVDVV